jgi:hypothetical protein
LGKGVAGPEAFDNEEEKPMTQEVKAHQLRLIEEEPFFSKLARWVKAMWHKLSQKEGKTWNGKKW